MADGLLKKASASLATYRDLLLEPPSARRVKRFLIAVNGWCNSRCTFCSIWQYDKRLALSEEVTLDELERNFLPSDVLRDVLDIGITGGEPYLRRDLAELCGAFFERFPRARIGVVTNGLLPARVADVTKHIAARHPNRQLSVAVSLDGYGEVHDRVRGVPGNFERVLQTVALLKARAPGVSLGFSHTITPTNLSDATRCYDLARELRIGFMYRLAHASPYLRNTDTNAPIWDSDSLSAARAVMVDLARRLQADQAPLGRLANAHYASNVFYERMSEYAASPRRLFDCFSGTHSFLLGHTGDIYPCINLPQSMGNVRSQSFDDFWLAQAALDVRAPIAAWQCHCWTNCETELSLARDKGAFARSLGYNLRSLLPVHDRSESV